jgi:hypothetical protein
MASGLERLAGIPGPLLLVEWRVMNPTLGAILLLSGTIALAQSDSALLFSDCSDSSGIKRVVQSSDVVEVRHALVGGPQTCYAVSVAAGNGDVVEGFLLGARHPAVLRFERQEQAYIAQALPSPTEPKPNHPKPAAPRKQYSHKLWNPFSARAGTK